MARLRSDLSTLTHRKALHACNDLGVSSCNRVSQGRNVSPMPETAAPNGYRIVLDQPAWYATRKECGYQTDTILARKMRVTAHTIARVQTGKVDPSTKFVAGALHALQVPFPRLFRIVEAVQ